MDPRSELAQYDQHWAGIETPDNGRDPLPDGIYQARIETMEFCESKAGRQQLKWVLRVAAGPLKGRLIWRYNGFETYDNVTYLKKDLHVVGLDVEKPSDLPERIEELEGVLVEVKLTTKGQYQNVYMQKRIGDAPAASGNDLADIDIGDDSRPF